MENNKKTIKIDSNKSNQKPNVTLESENDKLNFEVYKDINAIDFTFYRFRKYIY